MTNKKEELTLDSVSNVLWDEIHKVRNGEAPQSRLIAVTRAAETIIKSEAIKCSSARYLGEVPDMKRITGKE